MHHSIFSRLLWWNHLPRDTCDWLNRTGTVCVKRSPEWEICGNTSLYRISRKRFDHGNGSIDVPADWDPILIESRYFYATIKNNRVIFGRFQDIANHRLEFAFSSAIAQLLGFTPYLQPIRWHTFDGIMRRKLHTIMHVHYVRDDAIRVVCKVPTQYGCAIRCKPCGSCVTLLRTRWWMMRCISLSCAPSPIRNTIKAIRCMPLQIHITKRL